MTPAIEKMERRLAAICERMDRICSGDEPWPQDWEMIVTRSGDLVDRICEATAAARAKEEQRRKAA